MLSGPEALEYGLADRVLEPVEFLDESIAFALELVRTPLERQPPDTAEMEETIRRARSQLDDTVHGAAIAPYRALDLIEGTARWTVEEGYREEEEAVADLILSRQAQASLYAFDLVERRAKRKVGVPDAEPRRIRKVGHPRRGADGAPARRALRPPARAPARHPRPRPGRRRLRYRGHRRGTRRRRRARAA